MLVGLVSPASASAGQSYGFPDATVVTERLSSGNEVFFYVPAGDDNGLRAVATPVLVVLGDRPFTARSAKLAAWVSGLARIAEREQGVIAFLNPEGSRWSASDSEAFPALISRYGDATGQPYLEEGKLCAFSPFPPPGQTSCVYPGSRSRIYLFADRSGADFVSENVVRGIPIPQPFPDSEGNPAFNIWTPSAVWLSNAKTTPTFPDSDVEQPAYLVNAKRSVADAYQARNTVHHLFDSVRSGGWKNWTSFGKLIEPGYDKVVEHAITRWSFSNVDMQIYTSRTMPQRVFK